MIVLPTFADNPKSHQWFMQKVVMLDALHTLARPCILESLVIMKVE